MPENLTTETEEKELKIEVETNNSDLIEYFQKEKEKEEEILKEKEESSALELEEFNIQQEESLRLEQEYNQDLLSTLKDIKESNDLLLKETILLKKELGKSSEFVQYSNNQNYLFIVVLCASVILFLLYRLFQKFIY